METITLTKEDKQILFDSLGILKTFCHYGGNETPVYLLNYLLKVSVAMTYHIKEFGNDQLVDENQLNLGALQDFASSLMEVQPERILELVQKLVV